MAPKKTRKLQPWEAKLIGREKRFKNSWSYWIKNNLENTTFKENIPIFVDNVMNYMSKNMINSDVEPVNLYGKEMDRPWGVGKKVLRSLMDRSLNSKLVKDSITAKLNEKLLDKNAIQYASGQQVAMEVFSSCLMPKDKNPGVHFDDKYLVEFYNATGIIPDEADMVASMVQEVIKIEDGNYNDAQWRAFVMPAIIQGSFQKELGKVYAMLQEDALLNPAITKEKLKDKMDKATIALGNLYEDFTLSIANTTDYLYAPLKLIDEKKKKTVAPDNIATPLNPKEKERYEKLPQKGLIKQKDLDGLKNSVLESIQKPTMENCISNYYRSVTGGVGPEKSRSSQYKPTSIHDKDCTRFNKICYMGAAANLKQFYNLACELKGDDPNLSGYSHALAFMIQSFHDCYHPSPEEIKKLTDEEVTISKYQEFVGITDEELSDYEKVEVPKPADPATRQNGIMTSIYNSFPTKKAITDTFYSAGDILYKTGQSIYQVASDITQNGVLNINLDGMEVDLSAQDLEADLFGSPEKRIEDYKAEELNEKERIRKIEEKKAALEKEQLEAIKKRDAEEKASSEKQEAIAALPSWQKKLIGEKDRYSDSWFNRLVISTGKAYGGKINESIDSVMDYMADYIDPDVKQYEVGGKKLDKAWGKTENLAGNVLGSMIRGKTFRNIIKNKAKKMLFAPDMDYRTSGETVAMTCFAPTYFHGEQRPPVHFNKAYMDMFYNETGIVPDEQAIIGDMMLETLKVQKGTYTDKQWREMLMPQIIKGSYQKQLRTVFDILKKEYQSNKAITKEEFGDRMKRAAKALGTIYEDFSNTLANNTEYLNGPMKFAGKKNEVLDDKLKAALTPEQQKTLSNYKYEAIITASELKNIVSEYKAERKPDTPASLLEDFFRATSGYVGSNPGIKKYKNCRYDDPNRTPDNARCMLNAILTAKKMSSVLSSNGIFEKIFKRNAVAEQNIIMAAMKDGLRGYYGFDDNEINYILNEKTKQADICAKYNISKDDILGYKQKEVADPKEFENEQQTYGDVTRKVADSLAKGAFNVGKYVAIGGYKLGKLAGGYAISKIAQVGTSVYNRFMGYEEEEKQAIEEDPEIVDDDELDELEADLKAEELAEDKVEEKEKEKPEEVSEVSKEEAVETEEPQTMKEKEDESLEPEKQPEEESLKKEEEAAAAEKNQGGVFSSLLKGASYAASYLNPFSYFKSSSEKEEPKPEESVSEKEELNQPEKEELKSKASVIEEEKDEEFYSVVGDDDDEVYEEAESFEERAESEKLESEHLKTETSETENREADRAAEEEAENAIRNVLGDIKEPVQAPTTYLGGWWNYFVASAPKTAEQIKENIDEMQNQVGYDMADLTLDDRKELTGKMAKLEYLSLVKQNLSADKWTPKQAEEALKPEIMDKKIQMFVDNNAFSCACNEIIDNAGSVEDLAISDNLAKDIHRLAVRNAKAEIKLQKEKQKDRKDLQQELNLSAAQDREIGL